ncbi:MAG: carbon starvation protein A [Verrucomicrobia bacterium]|nr:MAG: carbon starvation protein A [Verrucomicrobiota bacterium]
MLAALILVTVVLIALAYRFYGAFLARRCGLDDARPTPAHTLKDGVDYVPSRASVVFGHHFSSIAGTGPIVGPIFAAMYFGWGPAWLWILVGSIFIGGVHDFGSMLMSIRNRGRSIAQTSRELVGHRTGQLFILFVLVALVYVIVVFADLTATTFVQSPVVATASGWFVFMALAFGLLVARTRVSFRGAVWVFVPLTIAGLLIGEYLPAPTLGKNAWLTVVLLYSAAAAIMPVQYLLQPRDFLSSFFLYAVLIAGVVGILFSGQPIEGEFFTGLTNPAASPVYIVPALFITIACGACSGFHSIVASGTTAKQLAVESDVRRIGYGGMLVEGILATLSLATIIVLTRGDIAAVGGSPVAIFATGLGKILAPLGVPAQFATDFALLAVNTFLLTTLDTCTRLCRFLLEELLDWRSELSRYLGTLLVLLVPAALVYQTFDGQPAWKVVWPLFGSTNQLLAALALMTFAVYLRVHRIRAGFVVFPAVVMLAMPLAALAMMVAQYSLFSLLGGSSAAMFALGVYVGWRSLTVVFKGPDDGQAQAASAPAKA